MERRGRESGTGKSKSVAMCEAEGVIAAEKTTICFEVLVCRYEHQNITRKGGRYGSGDGEVYLLDSGGCGKDSSIPT
jgi:hypothetical protein